MSRVGSKGRSKVRGEKKEANSAEEENLEVLPQLSWRIINEITTKQLEIANVHEVAKKFAEVLSLGEYETSLKEGAQLDYFVAGYWFASKEAKFSNEQTSSFITILHILLDNLKTKHLSLGENMIELQAMLCGVGCAKVQTCLECYTTDISITTLLYIQHSLFQHYSLFKYIFTEEQQVEVVTTDLTVEVANTNDSLMPFPFPLEESVPLELYETFMVPQPLQSTPEPTETKEERMDGSDVHVAGEEAEQEDQLEVSADAIKSMMEAMAAATLQSYQSKMLKTMKDKEKVLDTKLSKLEKIIPMNL